jgi:hypothetical protein
VKPLRSRAWPVKMAASMTCLCRSFDGRKMTQSSLATWRPSMRTNQPRNRWVTGLRRITRCDMVGNRESF